jgi:hypothetical protein
VLIEDTSAALVTGANNWMQTNASAGPLTGSVRSASPGFRNPAAKDYTLSNGSECISAAGGSVSGLPGKEYFQNELTNRRWRARDGARDLGAFESTGTNNPVGPYDQAPVPLVSTSKAGTNLVLSWPLFAQDFQLYESDLSLPMAWSLAPFIHRTNLTGLSVSVPAIESRGFFRLER